MINRPKEIDEAGSSPIKYDDYPAHDGFIKTTWEKFKKIFENDKD